MVILDICNNIKAAKGGLLQIENTNVGNSKAMEFQWTKIYRSVADLVCREVSVEKG